MNAKTKLAYAIPIVAFVVLPALVFVAAAGSNAPNESVWNPSILAGPLVTCTGSGGPNGLPSCSNLCDLMSTFANVIYYFIGVVIWVITPIMFAWGGLRMLMSRGSPEARSGAKKQLTGTIVGLLIVLAAYVVVLTIVNVLGFANFVSGFGGPNCNL